MHFKEGAAVYTADHQKAGTIDRVVLDPQTKEVTHLVIYKGFLFTEHKLVPIDLVETTMEDRVLLRNRAKALELPEFEKTHYVSPVTEDTYAKDPNDYKYQVYWYPQAGTVWWYHPAAPILGVPPLPYATETEKNIPEGTVALNEGAKVMSVDDEHVGDVERVFVDPESDRATHFVISQGLLLKERKAVPTLWVRSMGEEQVQLGVDSSFIDQLPEYQED